jgi:hypothetical protein
LDNVEVIDNFLPTYQFKQIKEYLTSDSFPWYTGTAIVGDQAVSENYNWQLYHMLYAAPNVISEAMPVVAPILESMNIALLIKAKANCNFVTDNIIKHGMHVDLEHTRLTDIATTAVYYINSNNGFTEFEDGSKVESVENRLVKFPATLKHTGTSCTNAKNRIVINFNYIEETYARY